MHSAKDEIVTLVLLPKIRAQFRFTWPRINVSYLDTTAKCKFLIDKRIMSLDPSIELLHSKHMYFS